VMKPTAASVARAAATSRPKQDEMLWRH
jgi:hypothetical protein